MMDLQSLDKLHCPGDWDYYEQPLVVAGRKAYPVADLPLHIDASGICVSGATDKTLPMICERIRAKSVFFHKLRCTDLTPIAELQGLRALGVFGNPKAVDFTALGRLQELRVLNLFDNCKQIDLAFLEGLTRLTSLCVSGGFSKPTQLPTLSPIATLKNLKELRLNSVRVTANDGLFPLERCQALCKLEISNAFPTEQFAFLSVRLPRVDCDLFSAFVRVGKPSEEFDTMIVGSRKPFLHSKRDAARIKKYADAFLQLQDEHRV